MEEIKFSKESDLLIDFTKELILEYNESLTKEIKNFRYKVNLNDSYERIVYLVNGKKMKRYTDRLKNSLKIDLAHKINENYKELNSKQIDGIVLNEITDILKIINIQPEIIHDSLVNLTKKDKLCRHKYDLNIYENDNLSFTKDCLEINYMNLSKPILKYIGKSSNRKNNIVKAITLLEKLSNRISDNEYEYDYKKIKFIQ